MCVWGTGGGAEKKTLPNQRKASSLCLFFLFSLLTALTEMRIVQMVAAAKRWLLPAHSGAQVSLQEQN